MITIANPICDVVFKYLMEDERIARTIKRRNIEILERDQKLAEQKAQLDEQKSLIRTSVKLFADMGLTQEEIATKLNISAETVQQLLT